MNPNHDHLGNEQFHPAPAGQPPPQAGQEDVTESLIARLRERQAVGIATYGRSLETGNGRDVWRDWEEEWLDQGQYMHQAYLEHRAVVAEVQRLRGLIVGLATGTTTLREALTAMVEYRLPEDAREEQ